MGLLASVNLELPKIALFAVEADALSQKAKNGVALLRDEFDKLQADSPKTREFQQALGQNLEDLETVIAPKVENISKVAQELFQDMEGIEGSDDLIAQARATAQQTTDKSQKTRLPR